MHSFQFSPTAQALPRIHRPVIHGPGVLSIYGSADINSAEKELQSNLTTAFSNFLSNTPANNST